jgi:hypothetical protein
MIQVYLQGGLGNQLFQYAAGRSLAVFHNTELVLNTHWFLNHSASETPRAFELREFNIEARVAPDREMHAWRFIHRRFGNLWASYHSIKRIHEKGLDKRLAMRAAPENSYLVGYWQCEDYFSEIRERLLANAVLKQVHIPLRRQSQGLEHSQWLRSMVIGGIDAVLQSSDILMLGTVMTSEGVAIYRIGAVIAGLLNLALSAASTYANPRIAAARTPEDIANLQSKCKHIALISFAVTIGFFIAALLFGRFAIKMAYGESLHACLHDHYCPRLWQHCECHNGVEPRGADDERA